MERFNKADQAFFTSLAPTKAPEEISVSTEKEEVHPLILKNFLVDTYNTEWLEWVPENLDYHLLKGQKSDILSNKAQAVRICLTTDTPWREWHIFENVGKAFNNQVPNFGLLQPLSLGECETTLSTMEKLREENIEPEVLIYIATTAYIENYLYIPEEWSISKAQPYLDNLIYDIELRDKVKSSWGTLKGLKLLDKKFNEEDPTQRQLANLAIVQQYIREYDGAYNRATSR